MLKLRLTKGELRRQKEELTRFKRYLPMLQLKKKQLQLEINKVQQNIENVNRQIEQIQQEVNSWVDLFAEYFPFSNFLRFVKVNTARENIAGVNIPVFLEVDFKEEKYDLFKTPLWVDKAIRVLKDIIIQSAKISVYHQQEEVLKEEFRIATQRVNLFEKIKVPDAIENIRIIQIYIGELQTAEVVRGKIAKSKIEKSKRSF